MNPDVLLSLSSACLIGFMSSGHCIGMCGGIACALGLQQHTHRKAALLFYHAGRITTYAILALLSGAALQHITHRFPLLAPLLRSAAGLLLVVMALHIAKIWSGITALENVGNRWWKPLQTLARPLLPAISLWQVFALGMLWGWLPCALVYSTLVWAASHANAAESAMLMLCFGLGTTPALLAGGILSQNLHALFEHRQWRLAAALLLGSYGTWTIVVSWEHAGH